MYENYHREMQRSIDISETPGAFTNRGIVEGRSLYLHWVPSECIAERRVPALDPSGSPMPTLRWARIAMRFQSHTRNETLGIEWEVGFWKHARQVWCKRL